METAMRAMQALKPSVSARGLMTGWKTSMPSTRPSTNTSIPIVCEKGGRARVGRERRARWRRCALAPTPRNHARTRVGGSATIAPPGRNRARASACP
eukprot:scaffold10469_cov118-Isochrysis_galbana.AAC.7